MTFVRVRNLGKKYSGGFRLNDISFDLEKGETLTLLGPSGSGKTSLLRNICGLDMPDTGSIRVDGVDITGLPTVKRNIGMIFQDLAIFPHMNVFDNIAYGLRPRRLPRKDVEERVETLSSMLRISDLLERYPGQISGGQRQRVALARSVAPSPSVLLLDEPMSSLDLQLRSSVRGDIKSFARKLELTMIYVTHDHREGLYMGDLTGVMFDGMLEETGVPKEIFSQPRNERVARFFGYNVLTLDEEKIAFRPSEYEVSPGSGSLRGTVESVGYEGEFSRVQLVFENDEKAQLEMPDAMAPDLLRVGDIIEFKPTRPVFLQ